MAKRKRLKTGTFHKRKTNRKSITFSKREKSVESIKESLDLKTWSKFDYLYYKNKPDGKHYKPPQGLTVIFTITNKGKEYHVTRITPLDFVVSKKSMREFVKDQISELEELWDSARDAMDEGEEVDSDIPLDYLEKLEPGKISDITLAFIYGQ